MNGYRVSQQKAQLVQTHVTYLGFEISGGQRELGTERKEAICRTPEPQTVKELRTFLGMTASFLSDAPAEPVIHDCLETMETVYSSRPDLKEEPMEDAEETWFTDGSSFVTQGQRKAGYAITTTQQVIESKPLPPGTSAQKAEIVALTRALELAAGKRVNIWTDSKYAFGVVHAHGAIWKERGLLTAQGKQIKHAEEILKLLEAVKQPEKVAIMHCRGHQRGSTDFEIGNRLADKEARKAAERGQVEVLALIPDGKIQTLEKGQAPKYSKEDLKLIEDLKGKLNVDGWAHLKDNRVVMPSNLVWPMVLGEHNKTHWGANVLYKLLNRVLVARNLYTTIRQVTQQCDTCMRHNPNTGNRVTFGVIDKGNYSGQLWQIDFSELPRKGGYCYLLVLTDMISGRPEAFPCRTNKARRSG
nr:uncharacterized protein LOC119714306 [Anas platyrhynchos]